MKKYTITLSEEQWRVVKALASTQMVMTQAAIYHDPDDYTDPLLKRDVYEIAPRALNIIEEHLALGPEPVLCDEEET